MTNIKERHLLIIALERHLLIIAFLLLTFRLSGQYYSSGADPASVCWQQINTERFRLVFPVEFLTPATRLAIYLDSIAPLVEASMHHRPGKIDVLIHGRSAYSNGFVSWAPKRIEMYPNPHQNIYSTDWLEQLAAHEYRHVVQIDKLNQGFTRFAGWLTGQQATGAVLGAYLPMWFLEGDAVITETTLSNSGRGRWPVFSQSLRARLTAYGPDSYDKAYLGSYADFVPDYYKMGYHLTARARAKYGAEIWSDAVRNTGRNSWSLTPFRHIIKSTTGKNPKNLYTDIFNELTQEWRLQDKNLNPSSFTLIQQATDDYTNYQHPVMVPNGSIIAGVSGPGQRQRIEEIKPDGSSKTLVFTGIRDDEPLAANEKWVVWSENKPHLRWPNADYSVLRVLNRNSGETGTIKPFSRYASPSLKTGSDTLVTVESTADYRFFITTINLSTGDIIKRIPTPEDAYPLHPSWSDQPGEVVVILLANSGKSIASLNTADETWQTLRPSAWDEPRYPVKAGNTLWFSASTTEAEEIFRLDLSSGQTRQVTRARFGAASPALTSRHDTLVYADYTPRGYQLVSAPAMQTITDKGATPANLTTPLVEKLIEQEPLLQDSAQHEINPTQLNARRYSKWNLFNLHSWAPLNINIDDEAINPGITLMSQNLLGTAITTLGYNAARSHSREKFQAGFTWAGWYPILDFDVKWGDHAQDFNEIYVSKTDTFTFDRLGSKGRQLKIETTVRLPLVFNKGPWFRMLQPRAKLSWLNISNPSYLQTFYTLDPPRQLVKTGRTDTIDLYRDIDYWGMEYSLYFHNLLRGTIRDAGTRGGLSGEVIYRHTPWGSYNAGHQLAVYGRLYFPGIARHHALSITNGWQTTIHGDEVESEGDLRIYQTFDDLLDPPRGYNTLLNDQMHLFRSTYQMPLWNPDASLANLTYIKRLRLNLFFDAARTQLEVNYKNNQPGHVYKNSYTSTGIELMADFHLFRFVLPFSAGYRGGYRDGDNTFFHEAVFSTSFGNFLVE